MGQIASGVMLYRTVQVNELRMTRRSRKFWVISRSSNYFQVMWPSLRDMEVDWDPIKIAGEHSIHAALVQQFQEMFIAFACRNLRRDEFHEEITPILSRLQEILNC